MRKLAQRAVIAGASVLTMMSVAGGADLLGQAHADPGRCADGAVSIRANVPVAAVVATNLRTTIMSRRTMTRCHRASMITLGGFQFASG
jgi:hypothetical protein